MIRKPFSPILAFPSTIIYVRFAPSTGGFSVSYTNPTNGYVVSVSVTLT